MKKPAPCGARARKPDRRCYELSGRAISYDDTGRLILIHGDFPVPMLGLRPHAWLLDPLDGTVFDTAEQRWYPAADCEGVERVRYTQLEGAALMNGTRHFGPWEE
jgi:hypothetical protein